MATIDELVDTLIEIVPDAATYIRHINNVYFLGVEISISGEIDGKEYHRTIRLTDEYLDEDITTIKNFLTYQIKKTA